VLGDRDDRLDALRFARRVAADGVASDVADGHDAELHDSSRWVAFKYMRLHVITRGRAIYSRAATRRRTHPPAHRVAVSECRETGVSRHSRTATGVRGVRGVWTRLAGLVI